MSRDEVPVYYREIQKNAYLKRIPSESGSKLRPLASKKPPLKPMWTLFCVHNGRIPYLEQYPTADSSPTLAHRPLWRACLTTARHVTASVKPHAGEEYDFLVDCDHGPVRMLAPDWDSMQDWVTTLRTKLHELKILTRGENVYCSPPLPPIPRAPARDPTSPLPPTPPVPIQRVPGIEITTQTSRTMQEIDRSEIQSHPSTIEPANENPIQQTAIQPLSDTSIDISHWEATENINSTQESSDTVLTSDSNTAMPSTSADETKKDVKETKTRVAKICGQNICLDDSVLKRNAESTESDDEFFAEIDRIHDSVERLHFDSPPLQPCDSYTHTQTLQVAGEIASTSQTHCGHQHTNVTVIKVSNKPPHTAIPIMGDETSVFDFTFKQQLAVNVNNDKDVSNTHSQVSNHDSFINIVNTEVSVQSDSQNVNDYGTIFNEEPEYGHLSLTTTVSLTGDVKNENVKVTDGIYEKLCLASTSNSQASPATVKKLKSLDKLRKSSLPNLDSDQESTYEYLFPNTSQNSTNVTLNSTESSILVNGNSHTEISTDNSRNTQRNTNQSHITSHSDVPRVTVTSNGNTNRQNESARQKLQSQRLATQNAHSQNTHSQNQNTHSQNQNAHSQNEVTINTDDSSSRPVERSHSQSAFDRVNGLRERLVRRQNSSPKREAKAEKAESANKPIWKRGLTDLSLLSRLRGRGQRRQDSPNRETNNTSERAPNVTSPVKVVHRSRPEGRSDGSRRRSSSLNNGNSPLSLPINGMYPLRARQAASLRAEQRRGAVIPAAVPKRDPPIFIDYNKQVWIAWWGVGGARCGGRAGDRVAYVRGAVPTDAPNARLRAKQTIAPLVDILFHRVPLGKIYVINKRDLECIGIKLDSECVITGIEPGSPAETAGVPPPGRWAVTEVNNRSINLLKGGEEEMNRLSLHGTEVSILIQPAALVKKIRSALKTRTLFG